MEDPQLRAIGSHMGVSVLLMWLIYEFEAYVLSVANGYVDLVLILLIFGYITRGFIDIMCVNRRVLLSDIFVISVVEGVLVFFAWFVAMNGHIDRADEHAKQFKGLLFVIFLDALFWYVILCMQGYINEDDKPAAPPAPAPSVHLSEQLARVVNSSTVKDDEKKSEVLRFIKAAVIRLGYNPAQVLGEEQPK
jgi:hypothetical protein